MSENKWLDFLKDKLPNRRVAHCVNVGHEAVKLAKHYGVDEEKAYVAGVLHDYCKYDSDAYILEKLQSLYDDIDPAIIAIPNIAHGEAAYVLFKDMNLPLSDDILSAIRYHTYGHKNMSMLDKIVFMADLIEPKRSFQGVEALRDLAYVSMDEAILMSIASTKVYVEEQGGLIHHNTIELEQELQKRRH